LDDPRFYVRIDGRPPEELRKRIADLHRDLDLLKTGWMPNERTLRNAPIIQNWRFALRTNSARKQHSLILKGTWPATCAFLALTACAHRRSSL
jgi:hypothetical protein